MAFVKKTWKDRIVQYANRRLLTKSGGEVEQVTVTRDEGTISEAGDRFDAATMNNLEKRVKDAFDDLNAADLPIASGSATNTKDYIDDNDFRYVVIDLSSLSTTANTAQNLGALSSLTSNKITSYTQIVSISMVYGAGTNYSASGSVSANATNNVIFFPLRTDTGVSIRLVILYKPNAVNV